MATKIRSITIDTTGDPYYVALFWSELLERPLDADDKPGDPAALIDMGPEHPRLLFLHGPDRKLVKNRVHLDVQPTHPHTRDSQLERALGLGATLMADHRKEDGTGWVVMTDPEGNEFCIERSEAELELTSNQAN